MQAQLQCVAKRGASNVNASGATQTHASVRNQQALSLDVLLQESRHQHSVIAQSKLLTVSSLKWRVLCVQATS